MSDAFALASGAWTLDARLHRPQGSALGALVVAHPHPAHGGHMDHAVVVAAAERAATAGLVALRFDFRGVRKSTGSVTDFLGHLDDWRRALEFAEGQAEGGPVFGGGFSYGARSLAALLRPGRRDAPHVDGVLLYAPATRVPRTKRDFGNLLLGRPISDASRDGEALANLGALEMPAEVIVGDGDVVAPVEELRGCLPPHAHLEVLEGLGHFFSSRPGAGPLAKDEVHAATDRALTRLIESAT